MLDGKKVLLVEDDDRVVSSYKFKFENMDELSTIKPFFAVNAKEAVDAINRENPDLVLLDLSLGDSAIPEGLLIVKEYANKFNIIVVSGYDEYKKQCLDLGVKGYVVKPFNLKNTLQLGEDILNKK